MSERVSLFNNLNIQVEYIKNNLILKEYHFEQGILSPVSRGIVRKFNTNLPPGVQPLAK